MTINNLLSSFLYWFKTDQYATVWWKNIMVAEAAYRRYGTSDQRVKNKILSYYDDQVSARFNVLIPLLCKTSCLYLNFLYQVAVAGNHKKNLPKRRKLDECTHLTDKADAIKNYFSNLDWVLDKLNNGSVLQVCCF